MSQKSLSGAPQQCFWTYWMNEFLGPHALRIPTTKLCKPLIKLWFFQWGARNIVRLQPMLNGGQLRAQRLLRQCDEHSHLRSLSGPRVDREFAEGQKRSRFHAYDSHAKAA